MTRSSDRESSGTVARTIRLLRFMGERQKTSIREASGALQLPPSTVHRLFDLLSREGVLEQDKNDRTYRTGPEFYRIAAQVVGHYDLRSLALPVMREIVAGCDETCVLGLYLPTLRKMSFAERVDSDLPLRYQLPMNTHLSLLSGASGRSILAFLPPEQRAEILELEKSASGALSPSLRTRLQRELRSIHEQGFAVSRGEMIAGAMAIAAPVIGAEGTAVASIGVTAPNERMQRAGVQRVIDLVRRKARDLSFRLGATTTGSEANAVPRALPAVNARLRASTPRRAARERP